MSAPSSLSFYAPLSSFREFVDRTTYHSTHPPLFPGPPHLSSDLETGLHSSWAHRSPALLFFRSPSLSMDSGPQPGQMPPGHLRPLSRLPAHSCRGGASPGCHTRGPGNTTTSVLPGWTPLLPPARLSRHLHPRAGHGQHQELPRPTSPVPRVPPCTLPVEPQPAQPQVPPSPLPSRAPYLSMQGGQERVQLRLQRAAAHAHRGLKDLAQALLRHRG